MIDEPSPPLAASSGPLLEPTRSAGSQPAWMRAVPGLALVAVVALAAGLIGGRIPVVGGPVIAIVLGMVVAAVRKPGEALSRGVALASKYGLQFAIILLGAGLSLTQIVHAGAGSLWVMLGTLTAALLSAWAGARLLGVKAELATLIGVGTAICGASAIAATAAVTEPEERDIAYAVSTIFLFNVVAVLIYPTIGHLLHLSQHAFGLWAGTAVNDTSSVVAAAYTYGAAAGTYAIIVKLTRSTMILPISLALYAIGAYRRNRSGGDAARAPRGRFLKAFPWFIVWFLLAAVAHTFGLLPPAVEHLAAPLGLAMIVVALAAIGLSARFDEMARTGPRPLILGLVLWATVAIGSLALQHLTGLL